MTVHGPESYEAHDQVYCGELLADGRPIYGAGKKILLGNGASFDHLRVGKKVFSMDLDPQGRIFIGGKSTFGMLAADSTGSISYRSFMPLLPDSLKNFGITWGTVAPDGKMVYFNTLERLFHYDGKEIGELEAKNRFYHMTELPQGLVLQDQDHGLFLFDGDEKEELPNSQELAQKHIIGIHPGKRSEYWIIITARDGLFRYKPGTGVFTSLPKQKKGRKEQLAAFQEGVAYSSEKLDPERNPYGAAYAVGTKKGGILLLDKKGRPTINIGRKEGLPSLAIWNLFNDSKGRLYATTGSGIALLHLGFPFTMAKEGRTFQGSARDMAFSTTEGPRGSDKGEAANPLIVTSNGGWVWDENAGSFERLHDIGAQSFDLEPLPSVGEDSVRRVFLGGGHAGALCLRRAPSNPSGWEVAEKIDVHAYRLTTFALPGNKEGVGVTIAGRDGFFLYTSYDGNEWEKKGSQRELPEKVIRSTLDQKRSNSDTLRFFGGMPTKGLLEFNWRVGSEKLGMTRYDTSDGLPKGLAARVVREPYGKGVLIATDSGLFKPMKQGFEACCSYGELYCNGDRPVFRLEEGKGGAIWISDGKGGRLKHLIPEGPAYRIDSTVFRGLDLGSISSVHPGETKVAISADFGIVHYFPDLGADREDSWSCSIRKVKKGKGDLLFGGYYFKEQEGRHPFPFTPLEEQPERMVPVLPFEQNRLTFHYAAHSPLRQEEVQYRYKLQGFDTTWSEWSGKTRKEYTNLSGGDYIFQVQARNIFLNKSERAEYRFRILYPWYRTWWAYSGYSVAGFGFVWLLIWLNGRRLRAQKERLEEIVQERTREIQEQKNLVEEQQKETEKQRQVSEERREKIEEAHQEITQSIDYAQKIQYALLQSEEHVSPHLPDHFILFKPQSQVSGDFYWAREHQGYLYIAAVDCTGHGVPGAFMSMLGISQLNEIMGTDDLPTPGEILTELRDRVVRELSGSASGETAKDGMDAAMMKIPLSDPRSQIPDPKTIEFAGAQNPIYVVRNGIAEDDPLVGNDHDRSVQDRIKPFKKSSDGIEIKGDAMPVGYDEYASGDFTTVSLKVQKGDMLYIFSDGYADQFGGPKGKKFRYGPFKQLLADLHEKPMEEQKQALDRTFEDWKAESEQEQIDDVVVIGVRV